MPKDPIPELKIDDTFAQWRTVINSWSSRLNDIKILEAGENLLESDPNSIMRLSNGMEMALVINLILDS